MPVRTAVSHYRGLRLTINQTGPDKPCLVSLSVKEMDKPWDQWDLLFPAIRVPIPPGGLDGYESCLTAVGSAIEALLEADRRYR